MGAKKKPKFRPHWSDLASLCIPAIKFFAPITNITTIARMSANDSELHELPVADPPAIEGSAVASLVDSSPRFLVHMKEYPLVNSATGAFFAIPLSKATVESLKPTYIFLRGTQPLKFVADHTDLLADGALTKVDKLLPCLKTTGVKDLEEAVSRPANGAIAGVKAFMDHVDVKVRNYVIAPSHRAADMLSKKLEQDIVLRKINPLVGPVNNKLERAIDSYLPHTRKVPRDENSCEVSRTFHIVKNLVLGAYENTPEVHEPEEIHPIEEPILEHDNPMEDVLPVEADPAEDATLTEEPTNTEGAVHAEEPTNTVEVHTEEDVVHN